MSLAALAQREIGRREAEAADHRARFTAAAEGIDKLRKEFPKARVVYAENNKGESIGKPAPYEWAEIHWNGIA